MGINEPEPACEDVSLIHIILMFVMEYFAINMLYKSSLKLITK